MNALAGTPALVRLALRRDRIRIPVWVAAVVALVLVTAQTVQGLYPTAGALAAAAAVIEDNPTAVVMNGPAQGLGTLGGRVAFEVGAFGAVLVALMSLLLVGRHTRAEEESGRTELVRAAAVGRQGPLTAALLVTAGADALVAVAVAVGLIGLGLPVTGSFTLGAVLGVVGLVFAGVAAVTAQVTEHARGATGLAIAVLGLAFVLRAAGDVGDGTLSWASPIGWAQASRPFAGERVWPVLLALAAAALLAAGATVLGARRDVGAGLVRPRPGPPVARASLLRPAGLALRLQRGSLVAWALAVFLLGVAYGSIAPDIGDFVGENQDLGELLAPSGGAGLTDAFLGTALLVLALIGSGFAVQSTLRLRGEEGAGRLEPVLAAAVSRIRWVGGFLAVTLVGSAVVLAMGGLGAGLASGLLSGDVAAVPRLLGAALAYLPAQWVLVGFAIALFGLVPRVAAAVWAVLAGCVLVGLLGPLLGLPGWVSGVSPFHHVPRLPAAEFSAVPLVVLLGVGTALVGAGLAAFRRRDIT